MDKNKLLTTGDVDLWMQSEEGEGHQKEWSQKLLKGSLFKPKEKKPQPKEVLTVTT